MRLTASAARPRLVYFAVLERQAASGGPLTLAEIQRYMQMPVQFGIVSAYKGGEKPAPENKRLHGNLIADLQGMGYTPSQIRPLRGQWERPKGAPEDPAVYSLEKSVVVLDMPYKDALTLRQRYGQSAVIWKSKDGLLGMYWNDGRVQLPVQGSRVLHGAEAVQAHPRGPKAPALPGKRSPKQELGADPVLQQGPAERPGSAGDLFSKARGVTFTFPINWDAAWKADPIRPLSKTEAERLIRAWPYGNADESGKMTARRAEK